MSNTSATIGHCLKKILEWSGIDKSGIFIANFTRGAATTKVSITGIILKAAIAITGVQHQH